MLAPASTMQAGVVTTSQAFIDPNMAEAVLRDIRAIVPIGLRTIDLYRSKIKRRTRVVLKYDPHWNVLGHRVLPMY